MSRCRTRTGQFKRCGSESRRSGGYGTHPGEVCACYKTVTIKHGRYKGKRVQRCAAYSPEACEVRKKTLKKSAKKSKR